MKTFLLNIPKRLRIESQKLDAQASLCDKAWTVFNDEGVKQLFIFQPEGSLLITINGEVYNSMWKYLPVNNSVVITSEGKSRMFHPAFIDDVVFALEQDGGAECLFMIDEVNQKASHLKSLSDLQSYINFKDTILLEQEQEQQRELAEIKRRTQEGHKHNVEQQIRDRETRIREEARLLKERLRVSKFVYIIVYIIVIVILILLFCLGGSEIIPEWLAWVIVAVYVLCVPISVNMYLSRQNELLLEKWKKDHPNDPHNKYLR